MVYRERTPDGITRLTGSNSGGTPGTPGEDGVDGKTPDLRATSTSSVTIGTGSKTFALSPAMNVAFPVGAVVRAYGAVNTNYMTGVVTASAVGSVTINVTETGGVGTLSSWTLVVSGFRGPTGPKGTRWGTTSAWLVGAQSNVEVFFEDGLPPAIGDLVVTTNGFQPGATYVVTGVVDATHADLDLTGLDLRGPQGPAGSSLSAWPVGSIFLAYGPVSPATLLGGGTWVLFGEGQMLVGFKSTDTDFDADGKQGGAKTVTLTEDQIPDHTHFSGSLATSSAGAHTHPVPRKAGVGSRSGYARGNANNEPNDTTGSDGAHTHPITGKTGVAVGANGNPHNNMPPYIVVHIWRRTA